jgi:hypothetical protein
MQRTTQAAGNVRMLAKNVRQTALSLRLPRQHSKHTAVNSGGFSLMGEQGIAPEDFLTGLPALSCVEQGRLCD